MWWRRRRRDDDFDREVHAHIALETDRLIDEGVNPRDARAAAVRAFGNVLAARERFHERHRWGWLEQFVRDLRYAWRGLWRSRAFVATTVLTLAVGIGLVTVVFTVFNAYVLRPFAVRDPSSLHAIGWDSQEASGHTFRWKDYEDFRAREDLFDAVVADTVRLVTSNGGTVSAGFVSGNYFEALGAPILIGRGLREYDATAPGSAPVVVLSHPTWTRLFDRDPAILGREIELEHQRLVIVGVTRGEFQGLDETPQDLWLPVTMHAAVIGQELSGPSGSRVMRVTARLKRGVTAAQAQAALALEPFAARVAGRVDAVQARVRLHATPVQLTTHLLAVFSPVFLAFGLVLVAACANASNVMLARACARHREIGVRLSLGASRGRVVRQLLTEGLLISMLAGLVGLALAAGAARAGTSLFLSLLPGAAAARARLVPLDFDHRVFLFALLVATGATLLFALLPALQATRLTLTDALRGNLSPTVRQAVLRNFLVGGQVAVSLTLLIVAATLVRNSMAIRGIDLGFEIDNVVAVNQPRADRKQLGRALDALAADPRIEQIAITSRNPLFGQFPKIPVRRGAGVVAVSYMFVSPEYFSMLRIPIVHGRGFRAGEIDEGSGVAIVSAAGANVLWPGEDPVGQTVRLKIEPPGSGAADTIHLLRPTPDENAPESIAVTIIGVAKDVVSGFVYAGKDSAHVYLPTTAAGAHAQALLVRVRPGPGAHAEIVRSPLQRIESGRLAFETVPLAQMLATQMFPLLTGSWIASFLGAVALALSVSGLYGVLTYILGQRTREIGIRMALGATASGVVRLVMRQSARLAGLGAVVGLFFAFSVMKILSSFVRLENVSIVDGGAFVIGIALVMVAVVLASYGPARRATRVDPSLMLRAI